VTGLGFVGDAIVSCSRDKTVRVWSGGGELHAPVRGLAAFTSLAAAPDGERAIVGAEDSTVQVINVKSGRKVVAAFKAHERGISAIAVSPDGQYLATCSLDVTIKLWKIEPPMKPPEP
jgi:WD40 repeat protein